MTQITTHKTLLIDTLASVTLNLAITDYWYQSAKILQICVSFTPNCNTQMLYTNQKTFRSLQVTPDLPMSTRDQFTSATIHSTGVTPRIAISTTTALG